MGRKTKKTAVHLFFFAGELSFFFVLVYKVYNLIDSSMYRGLSTTKLCCMLYYMEVSQKGTPVIIHFKWDFSLINHPFFGYPHDYGKPHIFKEPAEVSGNLTISSLGHAKQRSQELQIEPHGKLRAEKLGISWSCSLTN